MKTEQTPDTTVTNDNHLVPFFFKKLFLLLGIVLVLSLVIRYALQLPTGWFDEKMTLKEAELKENGSDYNTIFFGSSRVEKQVKPYVFDRYTKKLGKINTNTFNYGIGGFTGPEIFHLVNEYLDREDIDLDYVLMEIRTHNRSGNFLKNLHTNRAKWWCDGSTTSYAINNTLNLPYPKFGFWRKADLVSKYCISYIENLLNFGMWESVVKYHFTEPDDFHMGKLGDGYAALDDDPRTKWKAAYKKFRRDTAKYNVVRRRASIKIFENNYKTNDYNRYLLSAYKELISKAKEKDIELILFIPPYLSPQDFKELKPIYDRLPANNKIELANGKENPEFYQVANLWDTSHLNDKGATIFSRKLAMRFVDIIKGKKKTKRRKKAKK